MIKKVCLQCGNDIFCSPCYVNTKKYCSRLCASLVRRTKISLVCEYCGNNFIVKAHRKDARFCSNECLHKSPVFKKERSIQTKELLKDYTIRDKIRKSVRMVCDAPEFHEKHSKACKNGWTEERKIAKSSLISKFWEDPLYWKMQMRARGTTPNRLEKKAIVFFEEIQPNTWNFVGDGNLVVGTKNPDFVSMKNDRKLIEIFGDWFHGIDLARRQGIVRTEEGEEKQRIDYFRERGWDCLVVWEREFKDLNTLKQKILSFGGTVCS